MLFLLPPFFFLFFLPHPGHRKIHNVGDYRRPENRGRLFVFGELQN